MLSLMNKEPALIMKELEHKEQEDNERNEQETKRRTAHAHRGPQLCLLQLNV